jgi:Kef-type K+ transport system membrane component KefB
LEFDAGSLRDWRLAAAILAGAIAGKIIGGHVGARLAKLSSQESWAVGIGMNGRGIMELVIANIAYSNGFIEQELFTILVLMAVVTTFVTPILLKWAFSKIPPTNS